jgi:PD-(D/E)XK nuclease superfamily
MINVRASSLGELFDCPARWEAKHVLGMRGPVGGAARLGTAWHEACAVYDIAKMSGNDDMANLETAQAVFESVMQEEREEPVFWEDDSAI